MNQSTIIKRLDIGAVGILIIKPYHPFYFSPPFLTGISTLPPVEGANLKSDIYLALPRPARHHWSFTNIIKQFVNVRSLRYRLQL